MKKIIIILVYIFSLGIDDSFAQSSAIDPNFIQFPKFTVAPACVAAHKGKQYYNSTSNKMFYCNGSAWQEYVVVNPVAFTLFFPTNANIANNTSGSISVFTEVFDEGNDVNSPGIFTVPQNGIYHFNISVKWGTNNAASNFSQATLQKCDSGGSNCVILASSKLNNQVSAQHAFGVDTKLTAGEKIKLFVVQTNTDVSTRVLEGVDGNGNMPTFFSGYLVK